MKNKQRIRSQVHLEDPTDTPGSRGTVGEDSRTI
jgi:hypothetical protein